MSASTSLITSLSLAQEIFTHYGYPAMVIIGNLGNLLNIFLFSKKTLRTTSCNTYFLASAFTNLVALNVGIISLVYVYDRPTMVTTPYCKSRGYILNASQQMSRYLIVVACFDRFALCSTSARLRRICQVRIACRYIIPCLVFIWLVVPLHIPIYYTTSRNTCVYPSAIAFYNSIYGIVLASFLPPGLMLIFSLLIFRNLKLRQKRRQQIQPFPLNAPAAVENRHQQMKDQQALAMLLIHVFAYVSSTIFYTINLLYNVLTMNDTANKSTERKSIEGFATFVSGVLIFICPCLSFYFFTLSSHLFRKEFKSMMLHIYHRTPRVWPWITNTNQISSTGNASLSNRGPIKIRLRPPAIVRSGCEEL